MEELKRIITEFRAKRDWGEILWKDFLKASQ